MYRDTTVYAKRDDPRLVYTDLQKAVALNDALEIERALQSSEVDVDRKNIWGLTPLLSAAESNNQNSHLAAINLLLKHGADVNARNPCGYTALHYVVQSDCPAVLNLLLEFKAKIDAKSKERETPLLYAVSHGNVKMVKILVERGANVDHCSVDRMTPLRWSCIHCDEKMIMCLVQNCGADLNKARHSNERMPLMSYLNSVGSKRKFSDGCKLEMETLRFLLEFSDLKNNSFDKLREFNSLTDFSQKLILEQIAKLQALNSNSVHSSLLEAVDKSIEPVYKDYFEQCTRELDLAKSKKLSHSWVTFFHILVDDKRKIVKYAGNDDIVEDFENGSWEENFPIYGHLMQEKMKKGIETRKLFDRSAATLSYYCPIFNPTHLIVRDILEYLTFEDYAVFG